MTAVSRLKRPVRHVLEQQYPDGTVERTEFEITETLVAYPHVSTVVNGVLSTTILPMSSGGHIEIRGTVLSQSVSRSTKKGRR